MEKHRRKNKEKPRGTHVGLDQTEWAVGKRERHIQNLLLFTGFYKGRFFWRGERKTKVLTFKK